MAVITFAGFLGENRALEPMLLQDGVQTIATNQKPGRGDLRPWRLPYTVASIPSNAQTIYRMGRDVVSDTQYWLSWTNEVHAVRGFSATDTTEQTFYTGDGIPKFTNNILGLSSAPYPTTYRPMGLPAPVTAPAVVGLSTVLPNAGKYAWTITTAEIGTLVAGQKFRINTENTNAIITLVNGTSGKVDAASLVSQINPINDISAIAVTETATEPGGVKIVSDVVGANFSIEVLVGTEESYASGVATTTNYIVATATSSTSGATYTVGATISGSSMVAGTTYRINSIGTSDFTTKGAPSNTSMLIFTATGPVTGTGTVDIITVTSGSITYSVTATITAAQIAAMTVDKQFTVKVNQDAPVQISVAAGVGTYPSQVTADTVKSAFGSVSGLTATILTDTTTGAKSVKLDVNTGYQSGGLTIKTITAGTVDHYSTYAEGLEIKADDNTTVSTYYVYTFVNDLGWESAPSPVSAEAVRYSGTSVRVSGFDSAPTGNYGINTIRVYKTQTGGDTTNFYFLEDISLGTSHVDDTDQALGEVLETTTWLPAPGVPTGGSLDTTEPVLSDLTTMWNGMLAGISGSAVRICEPYVPYAWPKAYELIPPDSKPIALGVYGQNLVVVTTGRPLLVNGSGPDGLDQQKIEMPQGCVSERSVVSMGNGVAWASEDGLCWFGSSGARLLTAGIMLREDWQALTPSSIIGCMYEGLYFGSYLPAGGDGNRKGFFIDPTDPKGIYFMSTGYAAMHFDELRDHLYVRDNTSIKKWDADPSNFMTYKAKSKVYKQGYPTNFSAAEVVAEAYPVTFRLYADGSEVFSTSVTSRAPFRLPSGFRAYDYQIELEGTKPIVGCAIASSMKELGDV